MTHWVICGSMKEANALAKSRGDCTFVGGPAYMAGNRPPAGTLVTFTADFLRGMPALSPYYLAMLGGTIKDAELRGVVEDLLIHLSMGWEVDELMTKAKGMIEDAAITIRDDDGVAAPNGDDGAATGGGDGGSHDPAGAEGEEEGAESVGDDREGVADALEDW